MHAINQDVYVKSLACPLFVPLVEKGDLHSDATRKIVTESLISLHQEKLDTLILGCTHYPLLQPLIEEVMGENVRVISSGDETAREVSFILEHEGLLNTQPEKKEHRFYTTGNAESFQANASQMLGEKIDHVLHIDLGS
jgi:glutamate racemase